MSNKNEVCAVRSSASLIPDQFSEERSWVEVPRSFCWTGVPVQCLHHTVLEAGHCPRDRWWWFLSLAVKLEPEQITHTHTHTQSQTRLGRESLNRKQRRQTSLFSCYSLSSRILLYDIKAQDKFKLLKWFPTWLSCPHCFYPGNILNIQC